VATDSYLLTRGFNLRVAVLAARKIRYSEQFEVGVPNFRYSDDMGYPPSNDLGAGPWPTRSMHEDDGEVSGQ
jgi:hypothetical protein